VQGDFDGDGKADITVFRPTEARWITVPSSGGPWIDRIFGAANLIDVPLRAPIASLYAVGRFPGYGARTTSLVMGPPPAFVEPNPMLAAAPATDTTATKPRNTTRRS
jgi:hypothetical protein